MKAAHSTIPCVCKFPEVICYLVIADGVIEPLRSNSSVLKVAWKQKRDDVLWRLA